ncbi:MAG: SpoIID/LytB domain-containing protein [Bacteroides sp.]|nr:SpoIID/LytB domain-containing protein [Bacteroides sp.]
MEEPKVQVGILFEPQIEFVLLDQYRMSGTHCDGVITHSMVVSGKQVATYDQGKILWNGRRYGELIFEPLSEDITAFELLDVTIGINFHWERKEDQRFQGALKIIVEDDKLTGINVVNVEDYLTSVISSEMSATASLELLKAHAVISRSWLLANLSANLKGLPVESGELKVESSMQHDSSAPHSAANSQLSTLNSQLIKWYERDSHTRFDVCADDHCQRYQGVTRASTEIVKQAIAATRGQVLMSDGKICDARFSKCCGGAFEEFQYCWEDVKHPYLAKQRDWGELKVENSKLKVKNSMQDDGAANFQLSTFNFQLPPLPDLTQEAEANHWIRTSPPAFCNTTDKKVLSQVLNNYDQETTDFYRWKVEYTQDELAALILKRSGIDYGQIVDLVPITRGTSGRLWKLKIVGTQRTLTIGKELEIRRTLSPSHLYSSAFVVDKGDVSPQGIPGRFILTGAGWGHGVGLCQIGAAVMGEQGYKYDAILLHYGIACFNLA